MISRVWSLKLTIISFYLDNVSLTEFTGGFPGEITEELPYNLPGDFIVDSPDTAIKDAEKKGDNHFDNVIFIVERQ